MIAIPTLADALIDPATYLAATLHALAREEHAGRRPRRLLEPNHATWQRFRGRLDARDFVELLLADAAVTQPEPFAAAKILGRDSPFEHLPEDLIERWLTEIQSADFDASIADDLDQQARLLGLPARPAYGDLPRLEAHHRVLELPGSGGRLAAHIVATQPGIFFKDVFTITCGTWQDRTLAGIVAAGLGVVGDLPILVDPRLDEARKRSFSHVIGLRRDKGGSFEAEQLAGWFNDQPKIVLVQGTRR